MLNAIDFISIKAKINYHDIILHDRKFTLDLNIELVRFIHEA